MTENIKSKPKPKLNSVVWNQLNWRVIERKVFRLQKRIYRAKQRGDVRTIRSLQRLLLKSWSAKLLAVRRVTQDNKGKKTAGIDGVKSLTPKQRLKLVEQLSLKDKVLPTRRVWIPKPGRDEKRPLGIPIMKDRATQALAKLVLEPEWEAIFEPNSYGFRPGRSCHDAIEAIFNAIRYKPKYVLDADIAKCFDRINHNYLLDKLNTFSTMRNYIKACLKAGVMDGELFPTTEGTPQGGVISPLLANIALHGMETYLKEWLWQSGYRIIDAQGRKCNKKQTTEGLSIIRYADDFVLLHENLEIILQCQEQTETWLKHIGLEFKPSKTKLTHTLEKYEGNVGFDLLGFTIRQFKVGKYKSGKNTQKDLLGYKTIIQPSKEKSLAHHRQIRDVIRKNKSQSPAALIRELNPILTGWCNYYKSVCAKKEFSKQDHLQWTTLRRWAKRRHPKKSAQWIIKKYWKIERKWDEPRHKYVQRQVFTNGKSTLKKHAEVEIVRHTKVKGEASPYNGDWVYWSTRMGKHPETPTRVATLLKKQKGKCSHCGLYFNSEDVMEIDHIIPRSKGGKDESKNLQLLHRHCHDVKTTRDGGYGTHDKSQLVEERNEVKVSRSVLKTSGNREVIA